MAQHISEAEEELSGACASEAATTRRRPLETWSGQGKIEKGNGFTATESLTVFFTRNPSRFSHDGHLVFLMYERLFYVPRNETITSVRRIISRDFVGYLEGPTSPSDIFILDTK
jgi:hypothetical protein